MTLEANNVIHEGLKYETRKAEKTTLCLPNVKFTGTRLHAKCLHLPRRCFNPTSDEGTHVVGKVDRKDMENPSMFQC